MKLPVSFADREIECDKHNIQQAINMMNEKQSKVSLNRLRRYCKNTTKSVRYLLSYRWLYE